MPEMERREQIPCIEELLELIQDKVHEDAAFKLNIELKNSVYPYPGMEEKIVDLVQKSRITETYRIFYILCKIIGEISRD